MGAGPWTFYYNMRAAIGSGGIDLSSDVFVMQLFGSDSNCIDLTRVSAVEITDEVIDGNGYTVGGKVLSNVQWDVASTPDKYRFSSDTTQWNATGGDIVGIRYGVISRQSDGLLICVAELEDHDIVVTDGNPFVVQNNVGGIFDMK